MEPQAARELSAIARMIGSTLPFVAGEAGVDRSGHFWEQLEG
jgi:hypothetical protein